MAGHSVHDHLCMIKHIDELLVSIVGNPGSREVLGPTDIVFEPSAHLAPQPLNEFLLLVTVQPWQHLMFFLLLRLLFLEGSHRHLSLHLLCWTVRTSWGTDWSLRSHNSQSANTWNFDPSCQLCTVPWFWLDTISAHSNNNRPLSILVR